jgi:hypothetical protein
MKLFLLSLYFFSLGAVQLTQQQQYQEEAGNDYYYYEEITPNGNSQAPNQMDSENSNNQKGFDPNKDFFDQPL